MKRARKQRDRRRQATHRVNHQHGAFVGKTAFQKFVVDMLAVCQEWCYNLDVLMWMGSGSGAQNLLDQNYYMQNWIFTGPEDERNTSLAPICSIDDLLLAPRLLKMYLNAEDILPEYTDSDYYVLRRVADVGRNVTVIHGRNNPDFAAARGFEPACRGDLKTHVRAICISSVYELT